MYFLVPMARLRELVEPDLAIWTGPTQVVLSLAYRDPPEPELHRPALSIDVEVLLDRRGDLVGFDPERTRFRVRDAGLPVADELHSVSAYDYYAEEARLIIAALVELRGGKARGQRHAARR